MGRIVPVDNLYSIEDVFLKIGQCHTSQKTKFCMPLLKTDNVTCESLLAH